MDSLRGVVERITYHNEENGYTVAKLAPEHHPRHQPGWEAEVAIVGNMAGVSVGESVELTGRWVVHPEYGRQFAVEQMRTVLPATVAGIEKYLGSGLIKGVGPVTARRIVGHFGLDTLDIIEYAPERLVEVPGVGRKRVGMIIDAWAEQRAIKEVMIFLQGHGVSTSLATRIYKFYGDNAVEVVRQNPYQLAQDIFGIGFLTADRIARHLGLATDAPERLAAGVEYALNQASEDGHVYLPTDELIREAARLLNAALQTPVQTSAAAEPLAGECPIQEVSLAQVAAGLSQLQASDRIKIAPVPGGKAIEFPRSVTAAGGPGTDVLADQGRNGQAPVAEVPSSYTAAQETGLASHDQSVYLTALYFSEVGVSNRLRRLLREGESRLVDFHRIDWDRAFSALQQERGFQLAPQQREAVQAALTHRLTVLTGGPGTGKTTTVRSILQLCQRWGRRVLLAAPTGRAAKRLTETTGQEAKTLHRLLEFQPAQGMTFSRNEESPLVGDLLIVDEASMLDLVLTNHLLKALPPGMHLLLVGDVDQLPSVGAGNVLEDVISAVEGDGMQAGAPDGHQGRPSPLAATAKVVRLQTIFRQAAGSYIIQNAHRINQGRTPIVDNDRASDFFLFKTDDPERAAQLCVELVQTRIPRRFAIPPADVQVLSPMHRGIAGVVALNNALQKALNPSREDRGERQVGSRVYRVGDRVMQVRNDYDKDVYNGDMGVIVRVDAIEQKMTVNFEDRPVAYDFLELDELTHAYAVSVHKSQGSEYPAVVIPVLTSHYMMLQRNLLYTAVTRARRLVVLVGQPKAIAMAVRNNRVTQRYTGLTPRLLEVWTHGS